MSGGRGLERRKGGGVQGHRVVWGQGIRVRLGVGHDNDNDDDTNMTPYGRRFTASRGLKTKQPGDLN